MELLSLTPVLWGMCLLCSLLLFLRGETGAPARTVPAVLAAILSDTLGAPPHIRALAFLGIYLLSAGVYALLNTARRK